jgi:hypothetical protein
MFGLRKTEPLKIYLPFIYLYNYLLLQSDPGLYNKHVIKLVNNGISIISSDSVRGIFKTILHLYRLPDQFLECSDRVETDESPSMQTALKLRNLIELFWWSDVMPIDHPFYTVPGEILNSIYIDVQEFKKLQL